MSACSPAAALLEVRHHTRYDYAQPVTVAHHLALLQPLSDARQQLLQFHLSIEPEPATAAHARVDVQGNTVHAFSLLQAHDHLSVTATSSVAVEPLPPHGPWACPDHTPTCQAVAQALRHHPQAPWQPAVEFVQPSPFVPRLAALRDWAAPSLAPDRPLLAAALVLMRRLHQEFAYRSHSTTVDTPLAQVLQQRQGVCQDFAHLLIGALRMNGLAARYVSGYLLTRPPPTGSALQPGVAAQPSSPGGSGVPEASTWLGADASHAWVQLWCPQAPGSPKGHWIDLDPTNNLMPDQAHVRVAVGRDFGDVTPLRGVIRGGGAHRLTVAVTTRLLHQNGAIPGAELA